ncbi:MAG: hypothetical protein ACTHU0_08780 [Kofleriaceae bacterium]
MLLLDERIRSDGTHARSWARLVEGRISVMDDDGPGGELSIAAVDRVMVRYGREVDPSIPLDGEALELPGGFRIRRLRFHAIVDATGRDYLVWERPGEPPLCVVATMATAALRYLASRLAGERSQESEG